ncbi:MAG TPA: hypothetical protein VFV93_01355 [Thermomicrobiales bacterium]|nr:hypothetical protein [Thermomicrobiales bacterium]
MDPVSVRLVRASLLWLVLGFTLGALMLSDALVPGDWRAWFAPTHGHILFVGWFLQFAIGVGYWLLPRKRTPERPLGYNERHATIAFGFLNSGLLLRVLAEPPGRVGNGGDLVDITLAVSSMLQLAAIVIIASQIWPRIVPRRVARAE